MASPKSIHIHALRFGLPANGAFAARFLAGANEQAIAERITLGRAPSLDAEPGQEGAVKP